MFFDQRDEIRRRVARQRRLGKVRIRGKKIFRLAVKIGEIAASPAGDQNLFSQPVSMFEHRDTPAAFAGLDGAHESRCAATKDEHIKGMRH